MKVLGTRDGWCDLKPSRTLSPIMWVLSPDPVACRWPARVEGTHEDTLRHIEHDVEKGTKLQVRFYGTGQRGYPKYRHKEVRVDAS